MYHYYVSVWHEDSGLIIGGGNSKDRPEWSTFVVGEQELRLSDQRAGGWIAHSGWCSAP